MRAGSIFPWPRFSQHRGHRRTHRPKVQLASSPVRLWATRYFGKEEKKEIILPPAKPLSPQQSAAWGAHLHRRLLCLIFSFCAEHPGLVHGEMLLCSGSFCLVCCTSSANPLGAFETSTFAQPPRYTFLLDGKLIAHYHVARVTAPDAYRRHSQAAKVNDRLIGAKEAI